MNRKTEVRQPLIEALSNSPILQFLGKHDPRGHELRAMLQQGQLRHFEAGQAILNEGDESDAMYVLVDGAVSVSLGGTQLCVLDEPGDVFGEFGAITGELRSATVTAKEKLTCFTVSGRLARQEDHSLFSRLLQQAIIKVLLARLRLSNDELVDARNALSSAENQNVFFRMDNESLNLELDEARQKLRMRTTGAGAIKEVQ